MKTKQALRLAGSATALAKLLGITRAAISQWGNNVPELRVYKLKELHPEWFKPKERT